MPEAMVASLHTMRKDSTPRQQAMPRVTQGFAVHLRPAHCSIITPTGCPLNALFRHLGHSPERQGYSPQLPYSKPSTPTRSICNRRLPEEYFHHNELQGMAFTCRCARPS